MADAVEDGVAELFAVVMEGDAVWTENMLTDGAVAHPDVVMNDLTPLAAACSASERARPATSLA